jgi:hypothetical protein
MNLRAVMRIHIIISLIFGLGFLLIPNLLLQLFFGKTTDATGELMARFLGASIIGQLLLAWFGQNVTEKTAQRAIVLGLMIPLVIGATVKILAQLSGEFVTLGWGCIISAIVLSVAYLSLSSTE